jgi:tripartite-type tricarboxylate transporter receptor subunit TctC
MTVWYGAFGPAGMPSDIVARLNGEITRTLALPDVTKKMADIAVEVASSTPDELAMRMRTDTEKWGKIIKSLNITPQ